VITDASASVVIYACAITAVLSNRIGRVEFFSLQIRLTKQSAFIENHCSTMLHLASLYAAGFRATFPILYFRSSYSTCNWCRYQPTVVVINTLQHPESLTLMQFMSKQYMQEHGFKTSCSSALVEVAAAAAK
jgi:hypothetical protein